MTDRQGKKCFYGRRGGATFDATFGAILACLGFLVERFKANGKPCTLWFRRSVDPDGRHRSRLQLDCFGWPICQNSCEDELKTMKLDQLKFDNRFVNDLPADPVLTNTRRQVEQAFYSNVLPTQVAKPQTIAWSDEMADAIGLDRDEFKSDQFAKVFSGNELLPGMQPHAMCYGGHQFGHWAGQLGDGRAINLGDVATPEGENWTLQLKGAGPTPYSRTADGLAVLRSSIREFLCSEAMFHLGVPTTRALSLVLTGEKVLRDMMYDGNARHEPGAICCRVAPSFLRFGSFQIFASRGDHANLKRLVDFTIENYFPALGSPGPETYAAWFDQVCQLTCKMIVDWMRVGFVHGVMNTDNMSILGLTIDYGPYGWLEGYDPGWTPNTTDAQGKRYRFGNQPMVAHWNLYQLGSAIAVLLEETEPLQRGLDGFLSQVEAESNQMMADKLGLGDIKSENDQKLKTDLFSMLTLTETDMTIFYRKLALVPAAVESVSDQELLDCIGDAFYRPSEMVDDVRDAVVAWLRSYQARAAQEHVSDQQRADAMNRVNPKYVFRNYLAQLAIDQSEAGDHSMILELLEMLRRPYDDRPQFEKWAVKRPEWARTKPGCSMLSCSS